MAKHTITGHIYWTQNYKGETVYEIERYDMRQWSEDSRAGRVWVQEHVAEVEIPDDFDPRPAMVANLQAEKVRMRAEFAAKVLEIDKRISQLLAIECVVEA